MTNIKVNFYAVFIELFGFREKYLELPDGASVQAVLDSLCNSEKQRQEIYDDSGRFKANILLTNCRKVRRVVRSLEDMKVELKNGDVVSIFPLAGGG